MKIEQIIYLTDIAQTHSMTQSAQRLFISQQALSFSIKKLEEEFGATLLSRSNHGVELTEEGKRFLQQAGSMVTLYQQIKADFLTESAGLKGEQPQVSCGYFAIHGCWSRSWWICWSIIPSVILKCPSR